MIPALQDALDELAELRAHVRELQQLVVSVIPDHKVVHIDEVNLLRMVVAERSGTIDFDLRRKYQGGAGGTQYKWILGPSRKLESVPADVLAYVRRLERLGLTVEVTEEKAR